MFAKIFESIYDGTLADHWQAMVTFQQMLILADANGKVDMTPAAITRRTGIPLEIISAGIEVLERTDPQSRSKEMDGRRIARLDDERPWGWFVVNHAAYRAKVSYQEKREADRERISTKRASGTERFVYFAADGDMVKIGSSANPWARVNDFLTSNPHVKLIHTQKGSYEQERALHERFKHLRTQGEWFRFEQEIKDYLTLTVVARSSTTDNTTLNYVADVAQAEAERAEAEAEEKSKALSVANASQDLTREPAQPSTNGARDEQPTVSKPVLAAVQLRALGIKVNPSNPHLLRLLDAGVELPELDDVAMEAHSRGITSMSWVATTLMGRRRDAANLATAGPRAGPQQESKLKQAIDAIKNRGKADETRNAAVVPGGDRNRNDAPAGDGQTRSPAS